MELANKHKRICSNSCSHHLAHYHEEADNFLQLIITGNETWVQNHQPETKWKSMQWKRPSSVAKIFSK
jgi:hypothetical protein